MIKIENFKIKADGYIRCKSKFYSVVDIISDTKVFDFSKGINVLNGEIDSGIFGISYLISMYNYRNKEDITLFDVDIVSNDEPIAIDDLSDKSCYIDEIYPLFNKDLTVEQLVKEGLKKSGLNETIENIMDMFHLEQFRFMRPLSQTGNERLNSMAAIGYSYGKQIFCFPWLSNIRYDYFRVRLTNITETLEKLGKIVIFPYSCGN